MPAPTYADLLAARAMIAPHLAATPLIHSPSLSRMSGADVWLKCENLSALGSFKVRGALACVLQLAPAQRARGLICASTGNHGAAMAWAAAKVGAACTVVMPHGMPEIKHQNVANAGGRIIVDGADWGESCVLARAIARQEGTLYLEDGEDPWIMAGAGTVALEVFEALPDLDALLIPVGGGNFIAGCAIASTGAMLAKRPVLIGVQSEAAPAVTLSMRAGRIIERPSATFAGGIATTMPVPAAFEVMQRAVDDMWLASEDELLRAIGLIVQHHAIIVEGAGAAPLAALLRNPETLRGKRVVLALSARNLDPHTLRRAVDTLGA